MPPSRRSRSAIQTPRTTSVRLLERSPSADPTRRESALLSTPAAEFLFDGRPRTRAATIFKGSGRRHGASIEQQQEEFSFHATPSAKFLDEGSQLFPSSVHSKSTHASVGLNSPRVTRSSVRSRVVNPRLTNLENGDTPKALGDLQDSQLRNSWADGLRSKEGHAPLTRSRFMQTVAPAKQVLSQIPRSAMTAMGGKSLGLRGRHLGEELDSLSEENSGGGAGTRIMVYVRLRPMSKKEKETGSQCCVRVDKKRDIYLTESAHENDYLRLKRLKGRHFSFDAVFPDTTGQQEVYNTSTATLVEGVLQGRNGSVFCYGATGAGKTHTMLGTVQSPGVMVLALKDLFSKITQRSNGDHVVKLSYLEVYNETVKDLLSPGRALVLREGNKQSIIAPGLTQFQAYSADEIMTLLHRGNLNRTTEPTRINETSSRSHAILQVIAEYKMQQESGIVARVGKLSLIDLAGSERALATDQRTLRSMEGANINRSLLALSSCINALCEGKKHIPFRNSKLTQLLKDSLGGACQTAMIANISPSNNSLGETQNTLHWADRTKEIRTKVCEAQEELSVPEEGDERAKLLQEMHKENQQLRLQIEQMASGSPSRSTGTTISCPQGAAQLENIVQVTSPPFATSTIPYPQDTPRHAKTPGQMHSTLSEREFPERVTSERTIRDLQRTIQLLEMDIDHIKREASRREEEQRQDHVKELKKKDELIQKLSQRTLNDENLKRPASSPAKRDERKRIGTAVENRKLATPATNRKPLSGLPPTGAKFYSNLGGRVTRSQATPQASLRVTVCSPVKGADTPKDPSQLGTGRKRTFWDITNLDTPAEAPPPRTTRRNTTSGGDTPSMLLQPGFATRRRLS